VDIEQVSNFAQAVNDVWSLPVQIVVAFVLLYLQINIAFLAGIAVILIMIPINSFVAKQIGTSTKELMKNKDARVKLVMEALGNMSVVKMLSLDTEILKMSNHFRHIELKYLQRRKYLDAVCVFLWASTPVLVPFVTFVVSVLIQGENSLTAAQIITSIALLNMLIFPMNALPWVINGFMEARVSLRRLGMLFNTQDNNRIDMSCYLDAYLHQLNKTENHQLYAGDTVPPPEIWTPPSAIRLSTTRYLWSNPITAAFAADCDRQAKNNECESESVQTTALDIFAVQLQSAFFVPFVSSQNLSITASPALVPSRIIVISGRTGSGKTALLLAMLQEMLPDASLLSGPQETADTSNNINDNSSIVLEPAEVSLPSNSNEDSFLSSSYRGSGLPPKNRTAGLSKEKEWLYDLQRIANIRKRHSLRHVSFCAQSAALFSGSVRDNILFGAEYNEERYRNIFCGCQLHIDFLDEGIERDASQLSGGQRLRIGVARALYAPDAQIVVLDDPFASLDHSTAIRVLKFLREFTVQQERKTIICSTHSLHLFRSSEGSQISEEDLFLLLDNGREVCRGSYSVLHSQSSLFRNLVAAQDVPSDLISSINCATYANDSDQINSRGVKDLNLEIVEAVDPPEKNCVVQAEEESDRKEGVIDRKVFLCYFQEMGIVLWTCVLLSTICMQVSSTGMTFWLGIWASGFDHGNESYTVHQFLLISSAIVAVNVCATLARSFLFAWAGLSAASRMYGQLVRMLLQYADIRFFEGSHQDSTKSGQIANRVGRDTNTIDDSLPFILNILLAQAFQLLGAVVLMVYNDVFILVVIMIVSVVYYRLQRFYRQSSREFRRLDSSAKSPLYSLIQEILSSSGAAGLSASGTSAAASVSAAVAPTITLRVFQGQYLVRLRNLFRSKLDQAIRATLALNIASQWLSLRLQLLGAFVTAIMALSILLNRFTSVLPLSPALAGLSLLYASNLVNNLNGFVNALAETEQEMISVERVLSYIQMFPQRKLYSTSKSFGFFCIPTETFQSKGIGRPSNGVSLHSLHTYNPLNSEPIEQSLDTENEEHDDDGNETSDRGPTCNCCFICTIMHFGNRCCRRWGKENLQRRSSISNSITDELWTFVKDEEVDNVSAATHAGNLRDVLLEKDLFQEPSSFEEGVCCDHNESMTQPSMAFELLFAANLQKSLVVSNVTLQYNSQLTMQTAALRCVSFAMKPGQRVAVTGRSGAGKSSLLRCILALQPIASGSITLFGQDIFDMDVRVLRRNWIATVTQRPFLFSASLRRNLDPFQRYSGNDAALVEALHSSGFAHTLMRSQTDNNDSLAHQKSLIDFYSLLDSEVIDGGGRFSAGQCMLLSVARAILQKSSLLVLDEVGASLDRATYLQVLSAILDYAKLQPNVMVLAVCHRLEEVKKLNFCTHILTLDDGAIVDFRSVSCN
jgi:ABC-type multidrug transport system fused ATPase/permease subunit